MVQTRKTDTNRLGIKILLSALVLALGFILLLNRHLDQSPRLKWSSQSSSHGFLRPPDKVFTPEVPLCQKMVVENWYGRRHCLVVQFSMFAKARKGRKAKLEDLVQKNGDQIKDNLRTLVASSSYRDLHDPRLSHIKSSAARDLQRIVGPNLIEQILVPEWHASRY